MNKLLWSGKRCAVICMLLSILLLLLIAEPLAEPGGNTIIGVYTFAPESYQITNNCWPMAYGQTWTFRGVGGYEGQTFHYTGYDIVVIYNVKCLHVLEEESNIG
ncbi:MAG: hypothetical protein ACMUJM_09700 [bacterium]